MSAKTTESDVDCSVTFSEVLPEYAEEEATERGSKNVIRICNGTDTTVYLELHPIEMVRRHKARQKNFGFGVDVAPLQVAGGVNLQVRQTKFFAFLFLIVFVKFSQSDYKYRDQNAV